MEANEKAKEDLSMQHASPYWRNGATKEANKKKASADRNGLSVEKRQKIEDIKYDMDHPVYVDPFDIGD